MSESVRERTRTLGDIAAQLYGNPMARLLARISAHTPASIQTLPGRQDVRPGSGCLADTSRQPPAADLRYGENQLERVFRVSAQFEEALDKSQLSPARLAVKGANQ